MVKKNNVYGYGVIDPLGAIKLAQKMTFRRK